MSEKVKNLVPYLITLKSLKPKNRKQLLAACNKDQLRAFEEIAINLVKNTTNLTPAQLKICRKYRGPLKTLAAVKGQSDKSKRCLLVQKGGFVGALLPVIASVLGGVLAQKLSGGGGQQQQPRQ